MQKGFSRDAEKLIGKLNDSYQYFDTVCFSMFENKKKSLFETELNWFDFQNDEDKQLIEGINIPEGSKFLWHSTFTVFNDALKEFLSQEQPQEVYLVGLFSDMCLLKTAMDMFDYGMLPYIVKDLSVSSRGETSHNLVFDTLKEAVGESRLVYMDDLKK